MLNYQAYSCKTCELGEHSSQHLASSILVHGPWITRLEGKSPWYCLAVGSAVRLGTKRLGGVVTRCLLWDSCMRHFDLGFLWHYTVKARHGCHVHYTISNTCVMKPIRMSSSLDVHLTFSFCEILLQYWLQSIWLICSRIWRCVEAIYLKESLIFSRYLYCISEL